MIGHIEWGVGAERQESGVPGTFLLGILLLDIIVKPFECFMVGHTPFGRTVGLWEVGLADQLVVTGSNQIIRHVEECHIASVKSLSAVTVFLQSFGKSRQ